MTEATGSAQTNMARAAGIVMAGFVLSNVVGLVRQVLISGAFGTEPELDAFYAAEKIPNLLFNLIAGGALASAFVPTFTGFLAREDREGAWRLASGVLNLVFVLLLIAGLLAGIFAPSIVRLIAPFPDPGQIQLTASLLRVMLGSTVIFGVSGLLMGVLNAQGHFLLPALAPSLYWLGVIAGVLFLAPVMGVHGLAVGMVLGALLHLLIQLPGLRGRMARYTPTFGLAQPAVRQVARLMGPRLLGVGVVQLYLLVNTWLASGMPEGSLSAISVGWALLTMPQVVVAQAISIAALPTFSAQAARGEWGELRGSLGTALRGILFLSLPAAVGLFMLRTPIVQLLFQRGAFDARSTELTAWALAFYSIGLVGHSVVEIASRAFYALHDTRTPVLFGALAMGLNIGLSFVFAALFAERGWAPHGGLALANSLATTLEMFALLGLMRRRLSGLDSKRLLASSARTAGASAAMGLALWLWLGLGQAWPMWLTALGGVAVGGAVYWAAALLIGSEEARALPALLLNRWLQRRGRVKPADTAG